MRLKEIRYSVSEPPDGPSPIWDKHQAFGMTRAYADLVHVDVIMWTGPMIRMGIRRLCIEHERGHALTIADVVEGMTFEEAMDLIPRLGPDWENEKEAWMRSNAQVRTTHAVEFVIDCLHSYRRALGVEPSDWLAMRAQLFPLVEGASDIVVNHWWRYEPPADMDGEGDDGSSGIEPGQDELAEGEPDDDEYEDLGPGGPDGDEGEGSGEPSPDGQRAPGTLPKLDERDGWQGWMDADVLRRVIAGEDVRSLAHELRLPLENLPPIVQAHLDPDIYRSRDSLEV